jgi:MFS family permease
MGFGWFADHFGRARALIISMLVYSVATASLSSWAMVSAA